MFDFRHDTERQTSRNTGDQILTFLLSLNEENHFFFFWMLSVSVLGTERTFKNIISSTKQY